MHAPAVVALATPAQAEALLDPICDLYDEAFSAPPFLWTDEESSHHRNVLLRLIHEPTFGIAIAKAGGQLVGFAYGYQLAPGTHWWEGFRTPLSAELTEEWEGRTFALIDLAVQRKWRGRGTGRQLIDTLLASRNEERATLSVQPTAIETQAFYNHLGWLNVGRVDVPPGFVSPVFDVYVLELGSKP